jgi:hypothetical protein
MVKRIFLNLFLFLDIDKIDGMKRYDETVWKWKLFIVQYYVRFFLGYNPKEQLKMISSFNHFWAYSDVMILFSYHEITFL